MGLLQNTVAGILQERQVLIPMAYWHSKGLPRGGKRSQPNPCKWSKSTVAKILSQQEYCGDIINFKTYSKSFKQKARLPNAEENWVIFKGVHEPIIDRDVFEQVQKRIRNTKRRAPKPEHGEKNLFADMLYCADCGSKLWFHVNTINHIKDSTGTEIEGSPFTTSADGIILTGNIAPGTYTVQELIPENSLYYCKTDNPVAVTVTAGETAEVSFTNALKPAKIWIEKVDNTGAHLKDATFRLEWSADNGQTWANVFYSDKEDVVKGGCSNRDIQNGCLVSNAKGELEWDNLYPGLRYRVTEEKAPDGYTKLKGAAFDNTITADDLEITIRVAAPL